MLKRGTGAGALKNHFCLRTERDELNDFSAGEGNASIKNSAGDFFWVPFFSSLKKMEQILFELHPVASRREIPRGLDFLFPASLVRQPA